MLNLGDIVVATNNMKYVVIGFKKFTAQDTVFHVFTDNFIDKIYAVKAIFYPVAFLDKPLNESFAKDNNSGLFMSVKVIGKMDIKPFLIKSQMTVGTQESFLSDTDMAKRIKKPLSTVKELEKRLRAYPNNEMYRYLSIVNQHDINGSAFVDNLNYFIDNDFNILYFQKYKFYKVGKVKGKTIADKYINLLTHDYTDLCGRTVEEYEPKLDFYFQKKTSIFYYNDFMFIVE